MRLPLIFCLILGSTLLPFPTVCAQPAAANYDEAKVPVYKLPELLVTAQGEKIASVHAWRQKRRPEILQLFHTQMYGRTPGKPSNLTFAVTSENKNALGGTATRREIAVYFSGSKTGPKMDILLYVPNQATKPVPAFLGLNFGGNHSVHADPQITLSKAWMRPGKDGATNATEASRGTEASRWEIEKVLKRGYALATIYYGDIEPDFPQGWKLGVRSYFRPAPATPDAGNTNSSERRTEDNFGPDEWGAISAWAWGLSRALDYLETDVDINSRQVAVLGHSRLGKTALWAGARDERFALVISNDSGEGGASLSRRRFGETVERINTSFPHWFAKNFKQYNANEDALPIDQHMLIALMAPRPVYVASAEEDQWADPRGEFLSAKHAEPVYALFGRPGLGVNEMPSVNQPVGGAIGYHVRTGKHDVTAYDWDQYLGFADKHFKKSGQP